MKVRFLPRSPLFIATTRLKLHSRLPQTPSELLVANRLAVVLPTDQTLKIFETLLENVRTRLWNDQEVGLLVEALCVLPFIENAAAGIARIREVVSDLRLRTYQLRDVASALGESRCRDSVELLRELTSDAILMEQIGEEWIKAVAALDYAASRQMLLSFVDPELPEPPTVLRSHREDLLAAQLASQVQRDRAILNRLVQLCSMELPVLPGYWICGREKYSNLFKLRWISGNARRP